MMIVILQTIGKAMCTPEQEITSTEKNIIKVEKALKELLRSDSDLNVDDLKAAIKKIEKDISIDEALDKIGGGAVSCNLSIDNFDGVTFNKGDR